jgi:uncharacterized protein YdiU (UPF0061 family)
LCLGTVFNSIDYRGRYAYGTQPAIAHWNLARFAETLLSLLDPEPQQAVEIATEILNAYPVLFDRNWLDSMCRKVG